MLQNILRTLLVAAVSTVSLASRERFKPPRTGLKIIDGPPELYKMALNYPCGELICLEKIK
jgi:hypothetical protein